MDYLKHYLRLMDKSRGRSIDGYKEKHHIIPKSIFNNEIAQEYLNIFNIKSVKDKCNLIYLKANEHLISHLFLVKIFKNKNEDCYKRMLHAAFFMTNRIKNNKDYKKLKEQFSKMVSELRRGKPSGMSGKKWSEERRRIGQKHLNGKTYEEIYGEENAKILKGKRSLTRLNKTLEEICGNDMAKKTKEKLSKRIITKEWREKLSKSAKGKVPSEDCKNKIKKFMSNDKLNPSVIQTYYKFKNIDTGEIISARKIDMKKNYRCNSIHKVVDGRYRQNKGWELSDD